MVVVRAKIEGRAMAANEVRVTERVVDRDCLLVVDLCALWVAIGELVDRIGLSAAIGMKKSIRCVHSNATMERGHVNVASARARKLNPYYNKEGGGRPCSLRPS